MFKLKSSKHQKYISALVVGLLLLVCLFLPKLASADLFPPEQSSGSIGLQGTISSTPPTTGATIVTPVTGSSFSSIPITVTGLCPTNLLVKIFSNNVFVGSTFCASGSYSVQVDLFGGTNILVARDYDSLDQAGPDSNQVTVTFNDIAAAKFGSRVSLTSIYAKEGVNPGSVLTWPIIVSQGTAPYAISVDWGDGSPNTLISQKTAGTITISHTYSSAGIYYIVVEASDSNGTTAYLQVVAVANGAIQKNNSSSKTNNTEIKTVVIWWPALAMFPLILLAFWVGRRHELFSLRSNMERSRDEDSKRL